MTTCFHCNAEHPDAHYERVVHNQTPLYGPWISPGRLRGLAWQQEALICLNNTRAINAGRKAIRHGATVKVLVVDLADWQQRHLGRFKN